MKLLTLAAACAAVVTLAAVPAFAADPIIAKLAQPVAAKTKLIAGEAIFVCEADACTAQSPLSATFGSATCKIIAAKFGTVTSFTGSKPMDDIRLGACNSVVVARAGVAPVAK